MALPTSTASGSKSKPNATVTGKGGTWAGPDGWYFLHFLDGSVALVFLKNHVWQWSKGAAPPSSAGAPVPFFLGTASDVTSSAGAKHLAGLLKFYANLHQASVIMGAIDAGIGKSAWVPKTGSGRGFKFGSDAAPVNNPYDIVGHAAASAASSVWSAVSGLFGNFGALLVRVLEALVGVALLFLGLQALTGTGGQGQPIRTVKRYV